MRRKWKIIIRIVIQYPYNGWQLKSLGVKKIKSEKHIYAVRLKNIYIFKTIDGCAIMAQRRNANKTLCANRIIYSLFYMFCLLYLNNIFDANNMSRPHGVYIQGYGVEWYKHFLFCKNSNSLHERRNWQIDDW